VFNRFPAFLRESREYGRALKNRNRLLRAGPVDPAYLEAYDELEPHLRHRLANSPFNLCPACVGMYGHESISEMENYVRREGLT